MDISREDTKERELRRWLAKRLKWEEIPEPLWQALAEDVEAVLSPNDPLSREDFLELARERVQFARDMAPFVVAAADASGGDRRLESTQRKSDRREVYREIQTFDPALDHLAEVVEGLVSNGFPLESLDEHRRDLVEQLLSRRTLQQGQQSSISPDDPVSRRAQAFSLYLAELAKEDPKVKRFFHEVLGDIPLSEEQAEDLLYSPAAALFSSTWFEDNGVPLIGHTAQVTELERDVSGRSPKLRGKVKVEWEGNEATFTFEGPVLPSDPFERGTVDSEWVQALEGSVVSDVLEIQDHLRERFPWHPRHSDVLNVLMFILTGKPPWVEPIRASVPERYADLYQTVEITVWPWVPVEEVKALYQRVRKELNPTPMTSPKRLALFMFLMCQPDVRVPGEGARPTVSAWRKLMNLWNQQSPWKRLHPDEDWHYTDLRNFEGDFNDAFDQIVNFYRSDTWFTKAKANTGSDQVTPETDGRRPKINW